MNLSFTLNEENDILNTTIRDSNAGSVVYTLETSKWAGDTLATTAMRRSRIDRSTRFAFMIIWKGGKGSLKDAMIVLDDGATEEVPVGELLEHAPGSNTYGSVRINDVEYRWKSKGTSSRMELVNKDTNTTVAESQSRKRSSFFRKARNMSLEISGAVSPSVDVVLLTFILVWGERQNDRSESKYMMSVWGSATFAMPLTPSPVGN